MVQDPGPPRAIGVGSGADHVGDNQIDRLFTNDRLNADIGLFIQIEAFVQAE